MPAGSGQGVVQPDCPGDAPHRDEGDAALHPETPAQGQEPDLQVKRQGRSRGGPRLPETL